MMMEAEMVSKMLGFYPQLTQLVAREGVINVIFLFSVIQLHIFPSGIPCSWNKQAFDLLFLTVLIIFVFLTDGYYCSPADVCTSDWSAVSAKTGGLAASAFNPACIVLLAGFLTPRRLNRYKD
jgi:hypothetical protein